MFRILLSNQLACQVVRRLAYYLNTISYALGQRGNWKIDRCKIKKRTRRKFKELHVSQQRSDLPSLSVAVYVRFLPRSGNEIWDGNELEWSLNKNLNTYSKVEKRITLTLSLRYLHIGTFIRRLWLKTAWCCPVLRSMRTRIKGIVTILTWTLPHLFRLLTFPETHSTGPNNKTKILENRVLITKRWRLWQVM